ncbi:MAG: hypothetical protein N2449_09310, partial [Bacteroidales bacterium]|nr:hypothetical protein [Bacteroidales bacterium]
MKLLACLLVIAVVLVSCHSSNEKTQSEQISSKEPVDTIVYAEYNAKKMFYTLTDGTSKEETISVLFRYSPQ